MNKEEIMAKYQPKKCENQVEFDGLMHAINNQQSIENHPYLDKVRELEKQKVLLMQQKEAINVRLNAVKVERIDVEQKQKEMNRLFHQLKHELIELHPKGQKNEAKEEDAV